MDTRKITLIASIAAIALVAVGVGFAYSATTLNENNTASTEYVTLTQTNYKFGDADLKYDTLSHMVGNTETVEYTLRNSALIETIDSINYSGVEFKTNNVANDTIKADFTGVPGNIPANGFDVTIETTNFTDTDSSGWVYILIIKESTNASGATIANAKTQAVIFNGDDSTTYYHTDDDGAIVANTNNDHMKLINGYTYKTNLYFGTEGVEVTENASSSYIAKVTVPSGTAPPNIQITSENSGTITFEYKKD